jgi:ABC-type dipeptide/oligopeptide/nickel transport system permease subunit
MNGIGRQVASRRAFMVGVYSPRIIFRHILPNSIAPVIVSATMGIGGAILTAAVLGFLGLGAQPPAPEWRVMIGDGLRDALDPQMQEG